MQRLRFHCVCRAEGWRGVGLRAREGKWLQWGSWRSPAVSSPFPTRVWGRRELSHTSDTFRQSRRRNLAGIGVGTTLAIAVIGALWADALLERTPSGALIRRVSKAQSTQLAHVQMEGLMAKMRKKRLLREMHALGRTREGVKESPATEKVALFDVTDGHHARRLKDRENVEALKRVSERVTSSTMEGIPRRRRPDFQWDFHLLEDADPLAIALPDGTVLVSSAMVENVASDDELAAVLAHECAHVVCRMSHPHARGLGRESCAQSAPSDVYRRLSCVCLCV